MASYMCVDIKCRNKDISSRGGYCYECGKQLHEVTKKESKHIAIKKEEYKENPNKFREDALIEHQKQEKLRLQREKEKEEKLRQQEALVWAPNYNLTPQVPSGALFSPLNKESDIVADIYKDMTNLAAHEAGTKWMRIGTLLSFNATQQMIGAGFKAIIDQNKILIKQNELIYRELKKLNEKSKASTS